MNIFVLDKNPKVAVEYYVDKHVVKMILETAQMLSTAHRVIDNLPSEDRSVYKLAFLNHPCTKWVRETSSNYEWTVELLKSLLEEYELRYNKTHKVASMFNRFKALPKNINKGGLTKFALAMPDYCKLEDPVEAYRNYYKKEKQKLFNWKKRNKPYWL
jgi:hypothetical protein